MELFENITIYNIQINIYIISNGTKTNCQSSKNLKISNQNIVSSFVPSSQVPRVISDQQSYYAINEQRSESVHAKYKSGRGEGGTNLRCYILAIASARVHDGHERLAVRQRLAV